mgnify:CR=1 FL=1|jgi:hypothetical protein
MNTGRPLIDVMKIADQTIDETLSAASENIHAAEAYLQELMIAARAIEKAGMYPSVPSEQWQTREGSGQYLYMLFKTDRNGNYQGPDGARKIYVGNKQDKIDDARRLVQNRERYEGITRCIEDLTSYLRRQKFNVQRLQIDTADYPRTTCALGPA